MTVSIDVTQLVGVVAFGVTALCCLGRHVFARHRSGGGARRFAVLAAIYTAVAVEVVVSGRWWLHGLLLGAMRERGWYADRRGFQLVGLVAVALLLTALLAWLVRRRAPGIRLEYVGLGATLGLLAWPLLSLHELDSALYADLGPWRVVGWLWIGASSLVCIASLRPIAGGGPGSDRGRSDPAGSEPTGPGGRR